MKDMSRCCIALDLNQAGVKFLDLLYAGIVVSTVAQIAEPSVPKAGSTGDFSVVFSVDVAKFRKRLFV